MNIQGLANQFFTRIESLFSRKSLNTRRCCLQFTAHAVHLLIVQINNQNVDILHTRSIEYTQLDQLPLVLVGLSNRYQLQTTPTTWLLSANEYQIFMLDTIPVPDKEMRDALKWRLKSSLSYNVSDAAIDYFVMPGKKAKAEQSMIAAIAAKKSALADKLQLLQKSNILIETIDVPELALQRLTAQTENDEKSTGLLYFENNIAILNISAEKKLYFTRQIPLTRLNEQKNQYDYKPLCLDILRYFDYYQISSRRPAPHKLFILSDETLLDEISNQLSSNLILNVQPYHLSMSSALTKHHQPLSMHYWLLYGCVIPNMQNDEGSYEAAS